MVPCLHLTVETLMVIPLSVWLPAVVRRPTLSLRMCLLQQAADLSVSIQALSLVSHILTLLQTKPGSQATLLISVEGQIYSEPTPQAPLACKDQDLRSRIQSPHSDHGFQSYSPIQVFWSQELRSYSMLSNEVDILIFNWLLSILPWLEPKRNRRVIN